MSSKRLPDSAVDELVRDCERLAGGPMGPGAFYVSAVLGLLVAYYSERGSGGFSLDLVRILAMLARSRTTAACEQLFEGCARKGPPS